MSLSSDIALVIDDGGVIRNVATSDAGPAAGGWVGRRWAETVTGDTRRKIELLLQEVGSAGVARRREVNHPSPGAPDIPIAYTAIRLGATGPVLAVGRDLRAVAAIQQRFVDAQQDMEREYWRLRQAQTQRRLLEQVARDAVLVVDARTLEPLQANRAAKLLFGDGAAAADPGADVRRPQQWSFCRSAHAPGLRHVDRAVGHPFRAPGADHSQRLLVRARPAEPEPLPTEGDAVVVTDSAGRVLVANAAFGLLVRDGGPAIGRPVVEALGDPQRALAALLAEVRREGIAELGSLVVGGAGVEVQRLEATASLIAEGDQECIGLSLRRMGTVAAAPVDGDEGLLALVEGLGRLLGRGTDLPLTEVLEAARAAERHAIVLARRRSADDQAAAVLLGIPNAELQERMHRLGIVPS